jgi:uncharacterized protein Usg
MFPNVIVIAFLNQFCLNEYLQFTTNDYNLQIKRYLFIIAKLLMCMPGFSSVLIVFIYTVEDLGLRFESFAIIDMIYVMFPQTKLFILRYRQANIQRIYK